MTCLELKTVLLDSVLFNNNEVNEICRTCGTYTIGNAIVACELLDFELTGADIDILILAYNNRR